MYVLTRTITRYMNNLINSGVRRLLNYQSFQKLLVYAESKRDNSRIEVRQRMFLSYLFISVVYDEYSFQDTNKSKKIYS